MQLERELHLAVRLRQPLSLVLIDIDKFKDVNDTYGHEVGDRVLRILANSVREELRSVDTAARYGGEEFAIILPQAGIDGALIAAKRLQAKVEAMNIPDVGRITASFGVATFPFNALSRDTLIQTADRALYEAKNSGRNRVCTPPECTTLELDEAFNSMNSFAEPAFGIASPLEVA
jgi:diguanylate cyclase (GGDEF)-like protein